MFDSPEFSHILEQIVLGRYKFTGFGWVPYPKRVPRAKPGDRVPGPDRFSLGRSDDNRFWRSRAKVIGWPVGQHSLSDVENHLRHFLTLNGHFGRIARQADSYIDAIQHNRIHCNPAMRVAVDLFEKLWAAIEGQNKNCEACLKHSRIRARRGLRNPVS